MRHYDDADELQERVRRTLEDPELKEMTKGGWIFPVVFGVLPSCIIAPIVFFGADGELPWILQDIYDFFTSAVGIIVAAIAFPAVLYGAMMGKH